MRGLISELFVRQLHLTLRSKGEEKKSKGDFRARWADLKGEALLISGTGDF